MCVRSVTPCASNKQCSFPLGSFSAESRHSFIPKVWLEKTWKTIQHSKILYWNEIRVLSNLHILPHFSCQTNFIWNGLLCFFLFFFYHPLMPLINNTISFNKPSKIHCKSDFIWFRCSCHTTEMKQHSKSTWSCELWTICAQQKQVFYSLSQSAVHSMMALLPR